MREYDFTTVIDRRGIGSLKWDEMAEYGVTGDGIVPLSNAEMEFYNCPEITEGLQQYLDHIVMSYFRPLPSYYEAVCSWFERRHAFKFAPECIVPNNSLHMAVETAITAFTKPGDGVMMFTPVWPGFFFGNGSDRHEVHLPLIPKDNTYFIDFDAFEKAAQDPENTLLLFCSPHNPAGRVWRRDELERVADICARNNVLIISDEIHCDIVRPGFTHIPMASVNETAANITVMLSGCSKCFNIAGLDTSNIIILNGELRKRFQRRRGEQGMTRPNMLGLKATELGLTKGEEWLDQCNAVIDGNFKLVKNFLRERLPMITCTELEATYLMWLDMRALGIEAEELGKRLMAEAKLFLDDGFYFGEGYEGFQRVNIAVPEKVILAAMERLEAFVKSL